MSIALTYIHCISNCQVLFALSNRCSSRLYFPAERRPRPTPPGNPKAAKRRLPRRMWLNFAANGRMITMQTNLSAMVAVTKPAGGEMSGPTAHFLFGAKAAPTQRHNPGQTLRQQDR